VILPDSSAWIELLRNTDSPAHRSLRRLLTDGAPLRVTEPIVMELLAGTRTTWEYRAARRLLSSFPILEVGNIVTYERAAVVWRTCRAAGEPVRNTTDCLIAAVAIRDDASLLHRDRDFDVIARHTELRIEPVDAG
jgi:predicted nucleic acid-binding protein